MVYYEDRRYTIIEKINGLYDVYDSKFGERGTLRNKSKEWADTFIEKRKDWRHSNSDVALCIHKKRICTKSRKKVRRPI